MSGNVILSVVVFNCFPISDSFYLISWESLELGDCQNRFCQLKTILTLIQLSILKFLFLINFKISKLLQKTYFYRCFYAYLYNEG